MSDDRTIIADFKAMLCADCLAILPQKGQPGRWVCTSDFCKVCRPIMERLFDTKEDA